MLYLIQYFFLMFQVVYVWIHLSWVCNRPKNLLLFCTCRINERQPYCLCGSRLVNVATLAQHINTFSLFFTILYVCKTAEYSVVWWKINFFWYELQYKHWNSTLITTTVCQSENFLKLINSTKQQQYFVKGPKAFSKVNKFLSVVRVVYSE